VRRYLALVPFALVPFVLAADAGAQMRRPQLSSQPTAFMSFGAALQNGFTVRDGSSGTTWNFGESMQYTASLERALSQGASLGVRGNLARVPLTMSGTTSGDADALVSQLLASLYLQSGGAVHTVLEGDVGATLYSDFQPRAGSAAVGPRGVDADFAMTLGFGFGYSFSPRLSLDFVQTVGQSLHQKTGLSAGDESSARVSSSRLVLRLGLGQR
jgi:hypothetical protein